MTNNDGRVAFFSRKPVHARWEHWATKATCELWEAACLSLNMEPDRVNPAVQEWLRNPTDDAPDRFPKAFARQMRTFEALTYKNGPIEPIEPASNVHSMRQTVRILDVALYCARRGLPLAKPMYELARAADPTLKEFDIFADAPLAGVVQPSPLADYRGLHAFDEAAKRSRELDAMRVPGSSGVTSHYRLNRDKAADEAAVEDMLINSFVESVTKSIDVATATHGEHATATVVKAFLDALPQEAIKGGDAAIASSDLWTVNKEGQRFDVLREVMLAFLGEANKTVAPPTAYDFIEYLQEHKTTKGYLPSGIQRVTQDGVDFSTAGKAGKGRSNERSVGITHLKDRLRVYVRLRT